MLAHWDKIAELLRVGPHPKKAFADMYMLLKNLYTTTTNERVQPLQAGARRKLHTRTSGVQQRKNKHIR